MKKTITILILAIKIPALIAVIFFIYQLLQIKPCLSGYSLEKIDYCSTKLPLIKNILHQTNRFAKDENLNKIETLINTAESVLPYKNYLLGIGQSHPTTYLILLQNHHELRTNGGFFGSYAVVTADNGRFTFRFQDIGVPDGQLNGHVEPPNPVQRAFGNGWFKLRDSDWEADFEKTSTTIRWFLEKGQEINPDILLTLSLFDIQKAISIIGNFPVPEYNLDITPDNIYSLLQNEAEMNFFPGSTSKKDALTATGKAFLTKLATTNLEQQLNLVYLFHTSLEKQNILINSQSLLFQDYLRTQNWTGTLISPETKPETLSDTLAVIETNMGANKANCCLTRQTTHIIGKDNNSVNHQITINYQNTSSLENPAPPRFYGGNYINYLRFYLPATAQNISLVATPTLPTTLATYPKPYPLESNLDINDKYGFTEVGFFHITKAGTDSSLTLSYTLPLANQISYELKIMKQHGLESSPQTINLFDQRLTTSLETDFQQKIDL